MPASICSCGILKAKLNGIGGGESGFVPSGTISGCIGIINGIGGRLNRLRSVIYLVRVDEMSGQNISPRDLRRCWFNSASWALFSGVAAHNAGLKGGIFRSFIGIWFGWGGINWLTSGTDINLRRLTWYSSSLSLFCCVCINSWGLATEYLLFRSTRSASLEELFDHCGCSNFSSRCWIGFSWFSDDSAVFEDASPSNFHRTIKGFRGFGLFFLRFRCPSGFALLLSILVWRWTREVS